MRYEIKHQREIGRYNRTLDVVRYKLDAPTEIELRFVIIGYRRSCLQNKSIRVSAMILLLRHW